MERKISNSIKLYKYLSAENTLRTLSYNFLKFSQPTEFNDPYEMLPSIKKYGVKDFNRYFSSEEDIRKLYKYYTKRIGYLEFEQFVNFISDDNGKSIILDMDHQSIINWVNELPKMISNYFRVCCFSKDPRNILMWSHYAASFSGCLLEFQFDTLEFDKKQLFPIDYSKNRVKLDIITYYKNTPDSTFMQKLLATKAIEWKYESEMRLILKKEDLADIITENGIIYGLPNCSRFIKRVILGYKINQSKKQNIQEISERLKIPVTISTLNPEKYRVKI